MDKRWCCEKLTRMWHPWAISEWPRTDCTHNQYVLTFKMSIYMDTNEMPLWLKTAIHIFPQIHIRFYLTFILIRKNWFIWSLANVSGIEQDIIYVSLIKLVTFLVILYRKFVILWIQIWKKCNKLLWWPTFVSSLYELCFHTDFEVNVASVCSLTLKSPKKPE